MRSLHGWFSAAFAGGCRAVDAYADRLAAITRGGAWPWGDSREHRTGVLVRALGNDDYNVEPGPAPRFPTGEASAAGR